MNLKLEYSKHEHLSFDLWLTLIKSNPEFKNKRNSLFKDFFEVDCSLEKVSEVIRYYDVLFNNINENELFQDLIQQQINIDNATRDMMLQQNLQGISILSIVYF